MYEGYILRFWKAWAVILVLGLVCTFPFRSSSSTHLNVVNRIQARELDRIGPEGQIRLQGRWRDALSTSLEIWGDGKLQKHSVRHAPKSGPLSATLLSALNSFVINATRRNSDPFYKNKPGYICSDDECEIAPNGFGTVGRVAYNFSNTEDEANIEGTSNQVMVSCVCANSRCTESILMRPIAEDKDATKGYCLFERVNGKFSDCGYDLLRVSKKVNNTIVSGRENEAWEYNVDAENYNWTATGRRQWNIHCKESRPSYVLANMSNIWSNTELIADNSNHSREVVESRNERSTCSPPRNSGIEYVRDSNESRSRQCFETYRYAKAAAINRATQQDIVATGRDESIFFDDKKGFLRRSELILFISSAVLAVWFLLENLKSPWALAYADRHATIGVTLLLVVAALSEMAVLFVQIFLETRKRRWSTFFASADASIALANDYNSPNLEDIKAEYSVFVVTATLGRVYLRKTRLWELVTSTLAFLFLSAIITYLTVHRIRRVRRMRDSGNYESSSRLDRFMDKLFKTDKRKAKKAAAALAEA
ncbi:hypothetical protein FGB62_31g121 [Gracilaria domingensis]|nr:hypothetical protein FGB62_31g121 [Gracilaria domingensis]